MKTNYMISMQEQQAQCTTTVMFSRLLIHVGSQASQGVMWMEAYQAVTLLHCLYLCEATNLLAQLHTTYHTLHSLRYILA
jgi:hypothetical protein